MYKMMLVLAAVACLGIVACHKIELSEQDKEKVASIKVEIEKIEKELALVEKDISHGATGLIPVLQQERIEVDKLTVSILRQHAAAIESGSGITLSAPATNPNPALAAEIENEMRVADIELNKTKAESSRYSGGLIKVTIDVRAATQEFTLAMLKQKYLAAKYGLAIPLVTAPAAIATVQTQTQTQSPDATIQKENQPTTQAKEQDTVGNVSPAPSELSQEEIENIKGNQDISVESAYFGAVDSFGISHGITVIVKNNTKKVVKEYSVGMLGYDNDGYPLRISSSGALQEGNSQNCNIKPNGIYGKDKYFRLLGADTDRIKIVLACVSSATFYDGSTWENPYYKYWQEQFEDKPIPVPTSPAKQTPGKARGKK